MESALKGGLDGAHASFMNNTEASGGVKRIDWLGDLPGDEVRGEVEELADVEALPLDCVKYGLRETEELE